jgi:hypothetical protein
MTDEILIGQYIVNPQTLLCISSSSMLRTKGCVCVCVCVCVCAGAPPVGHTDKPRTSTTVMYVLSLREAQIFWEQREEHEHQLCRNPYFWRCLILV